MRETPLTKKSLENLANIKGVLNVMDKTKTGNRTVYFQSIYLTTYHVMIQFFAD